MMLAPTDKQIDYVDALLTKLHLPRRMLEDHCVKTFGRPFVELDRRTVSDVIDQLIAWTESDHELRKAMGQQELMGLDG
jgi:hypothetical protein